MKPQKKPAPLEDIVEIFDVEQKSAHWHELRRGVPTSSKFATILAEGKDGEDSKTRDKYMRLLAGEIVSGQVAETFRNEYMDRGSRMEEEAREWYARTRFADLTPVGFVKRTVRNPLGSEFAVGCSPDSQITERKGLEIKSLAPHLLIDINKRGAAGFPTGHRAQIQGTMWVRGWDEMDLVLYFTGWPNPPVFSLPRDDAYIGRLREATEIFSYELMQMVERNR